MVVAGSETGVKILIPMIITAMLGGISAAWKLFY